MYDFTRRLADTCLGGPACLALTRWARLVGRHRVPPEAPVGRILFVNLGEEYATLLAYPALAAAARLVGRQNLYFLAFEESRPILDVMTAIPPENTFTIVNGSLPAVMADASTTVQQIRRLKIDVAIDLGYFARSSAILCYLSGATRRVGFHPFSGVAPYRGSLMTHRLFFNPCLDATQAFLLLLEALKVPPEALPTLDMAPPVVADSLPKFEPRPDEVADVSSLLCGLTGQDSPGPLVLLNPNCSDPLTLRHWPAERYAEIAERLLMKYLDLRVVFLGSTAEEAECSRMVAQVHSDRCVSLAGKTSLRQMLVLCSMAQALVTSDSGPAYYAALTPVPVVTLFGPDIPKLSGALAPHVHALWAGIPCSPCFTAFSGCRSPCRNNACMQRLTTDMVFEKTCELCEAQRSTRP